MAATRSLIGCVERYDRPSACYVTAPMLVSAVLRVSMARSPASGPSIYRKRVPAVSLCADRHNPALNSSTSSSVSIDPLPENSMSHNVLYDAYSTVAIEACCGCVGMTIVENPATLDRVA